MFPIFATNVELHAMSFAGFPDLGKAAEKSGNFGRRQEVDE
jgi:hypothetical protein